MPRLLLFDIDGTLVDTGGAGLKSLQEAAETVFGGPGPALDLAGSTDAGVFRSILAHFGHDQEMADIHGFFRIYLERLEWNFQSGKFPGRVLPGVKNLLHYLSSQPDTHLGLLTGNLEEGAMMKMRHYGLSDYFEVGAFGTDHHDRNRLGPIALRRACDAFNRDFKPADVWVIGDTPKDIACARALGAPCLAVATGRFTAAELEGLGARHVVEDLSDSLAIAEMLLEAGHPDPV